MNREEQINVVELRNYLLKPGARDRFIDYFARHFVESQNNSGGFVLGAFTINDEADRFFWIRGFTDMNSRSRFLPAFYGGEIWKKFGGEANDMMLESDHVYLLNPLKPMRAKDFLTEKNLTVIDLYFAEINKLAELIDLFQTKNPENSSFWRSETAENDFPRLPVIKNENLLAAITSHADESEYQSSEKDWQTNAENLIKKHEQLILTRAF